MTCLEKFFPVSVLESKNQHTKIILIFIAFICCFFYSVFSLLQFFSKFFLVDNKGNVCVDTLCMKSEQVTLTIIL